MTSARLRSIAAIATLCLVLGAGAALAATGRRPVTTATTCPTRRAWQPSVDPSVEPSVDPSGRRRQTHRWTHRRNRASTRRETPDPWTTRRSRPSRRTERLPSRPTHRRPSETPTARRPTSRRRIATAACYAAAGIDPTHAATERCPAPPVSTNAIQHVLANCIKNPQAPGSVNALEHLYANQQAQGRARCRQGGRGRPRVKPRRRPGRPRTTPPTRDRAIARQQRGARQQRETRQQRGRTATAAAGTAGTAHCPPGDAVSTRAGARVARR